MNDEQKQRLAVPEEDQATLVRVKTQLHDSGVVTADYVHPLNMDELIARFEQQHYSPHDDFLTTCRDLWADMDISDSPDGDDMKTIAVVDTFARLFVQRYGAIPDMCPNVEPPERSPLLQRIEQHAPRTAEVLSSIRLRTGL